MDISSLLKFAMKKTIVDDGEHRRKAVVDAWQRQFQLMHQMSAFERVYLDAQIFAETQRLAQRQAQIERSLFDTSTYSYWYPVEDRYKELEKIRRERWRIIERCASRVLIRRKGTERSGGRNGAQVGCTHVMAMYESDNTARWLLGVDPVISRAAQVVRNWWAKMVSVWATSRGRLVVDLNFEPCAI